MSKLDEEGYQSLLYKLKRAKSDHERFAALLIISKVSQDDALHQEKRREIFKVIGMPFLIRLLLTSYSESSQDDIVRAAYASISANAITFFCHEEDNEETNAFSSSVQHLLKAVEYFSNNVPLSSNEAIIDCLDCLSLLMRYEQCRRQLIDNDGVKILSSLDILAENRVVQILVTILSCNEELWSQEWSALEGLLSKMSSGFRSKQDNVKFKLCKDLFLILCTVPKPPPQEMLQRPWKEDVVVGLKDILCSKITANQRIPALQLASEMSNVFGLCIFFIRTVSEDNFPVILVRLSCIEVGLFYRSITAADRSPVSEQSIPLLAACSSLIEDFCSSIAQFEQNEDGGDDLLTFKQIQMMQTSLSDVAKCIKDFISIALLQEKSKMSSHMIILQSGVRLLSSWMNIEYNLSSTQGIETIPLMVEILGFLQSSEDFSLYRTTLPVIMTAFEHTETQSVIMKTGIVTVLYESLMATLSKLSSTSAYEELEILHFIIQAIIGLFSSLSNEECEGYPEVLGNCISLIPADRTLTLKTEAYLSTLAVVCINRLGGHDMVVGNSKMKQLFNSVLLFLKDAHRTDSKDGSLQVTEKYRPVWDDISQLWMMCAQEFAKILRRFDWVRVMFEKSGWKKELTQLCESSRRNDNSEMFSLFFNLQETS